MTLQHHFAIFWHTLNNKLDISLEQTQRLSAQTRVILAVVPSTTNETHDRIVSRADRVWQTHRDTRSHLESHVVHNVRASWGAHCGDMSAWGHCDYCQRDILIYRYAKKRVRPRSFSRIISGSVEKAATQHSETTARRDETRDAT